MSRALLDVNVLLALLDSDHVDHERAHEWLGRDLSEGWASCAITENAFVRIVTQPRYPSPVSPSAAITLLDTSRAAGDHEFWTCDVSLLDQTTIDATRLHSSSDITDAYLLALAVAQRGRFVTFDRRVAISAIRGATPDHLLVL